jgi:hypothetical protein
MITLLQEINDAIDKPKAIGQEIATALNSPGNLKFYIKLAYQYPQETYLNAIALTKEAMQEGRIKTTPSQYFWGILKRKSKYEK